MTGGEETEYDLRKDPIRTEEREKDLVITRGIKRHVQKCFNIFKYGSDSKITFDMCE